MKSILDFTRSISGFYQLTAVDQLLALAWFSEARLSRTNFDSACMRRYFREAGLEAPDMAVYLPRLAAKKPPQVVKEAGGYRLYAALRRALDARFAEDPTMAAVASTLANLPAQLPDIAEREFLAEALNCYRARAYRGAIIMAWNLAFTHLVRWTFADTQRLSRINTGIASKYPKKGLILARQEHVDDLKESEFIEAARAGGLLDKNTAQILREKLSRRNMAAHPSRVLITQHSADDMITDLVNNIILKL